MLTDPQKKKKKKEKYIYTATNITKYNLINYNMIFNLLVTNSAIKNTIIKPSKKRKSKLKNFLQTTNLTKKIKFLKIHSANWNLYSVEKKKMFLKTLIKIFINYKVMIVGHLIFLITMFLKQQKVGN